MAVLVEVLLAALLLALIIFVVALLGLCRKAISLLEAKTTNENRVFVKETGVEAYSYAESIQQESGKAELLEHAVDYMRRQYQQRRFPFDYEQARAVIEQASWRRDCHRSPHRQDEGLTDQ